MSYLNIDYNKIEAQLVNAVIRGVFSFNKRNPSNLFMIEFKSLSELGAEYLLINKDGSRVHSLRLSGPEGYSVDYTKFDENSKDAAFDEQELRLIEAITSEIKSTVASTYIALSESALAPSLLTRTVQ